MRRPSKQMPPALWHLNFNPKTGFYEIKEAGILYRMDLEETRNLRDYFRHFNHCGGTEFPTVASWYKDSGKTVKKNVSREGAVPNKPVDFYPDPQWSE